MNSEPRAREIIDTLMSRNRVVQSLGMEIVEADAGRVVLALEVAESMASSRGICHGGYLFMLADQAAGFACMTGN
jgi:acyl-CoA thioesterase